MRNKLEQILRERIAILDGSWGVLIQREVRGEEAYRGDRFRDHARDVAGDPDLLNLTRPEIIERIKKQLNTRCFRRARHIVTWSAWARDGLARDYGVNV